MADLAKVAEFVLEFLVIEPLQLTKPLHSNRFAVVMHALIYERSYIEINHFAQMDHFVVVLVV